MYLQKQEQMFYFLEKEGGNFMYLHQEISKAERKRLVKNIEKHLKNYKNYKLASLNLTKQLDFISANKNNKILFAENAGDCYHFHESKDMITNELNQLHLITTSIDTSLSELTELETKFIQYRYFKNWTIEKSALEIGYSDKALFVIRNQVMDKLLISLGTVIFM